MKSIDYRNFNDGNGQLPGNTTKRWWMAPKEEIGTVAYGETGGSASGPFSIVAVEILGP